MLRTNLEHLLTEKEFHQTLADHENVMVCCGRMGPMCIPVFEVMEQIRAQYPHVAFRDMEFDLPDAHVIRDLPECSAFRGLPYTVYFKKGKVVRATTSIQNRQQVTEILEKEFTSGKKN